MYGVCELYFHAKGKFDRSQHAPLTSRNQKTTEKNNSSACYRFTQHRILRISDHVCNQTVSLILRLSPMIFFPAAGSSSRICTHFIEGPYALASPCAIPSPASTFLLPSTGSLRQIGQEESRFLSQSSIHEG
mmetsp:Transcript_35426/g.110797  ORF Transcript_35426/g.110797 Transcript_35426/m.110797 type:complete len:132 (+) Transcript_35426:138-533(+)